jgi:flagellar hook-associated protein 1 FlgK
LTADLSSLFGSFQSLSTDPANLSDRQSVVASAQQLSTEFNQVSSQLGTVNDQLNQSIQSGVTSANQDLTQIANLNQQIIQAQADGGSANDLDDQREQAIDDLANYANATATAQSNGAVNINIGGVTMVSDGTATDSLETYDSGGGQLLIKAQNAGTPLTLSSGSIEGNITTRDGALATLQTSVNTLASQLITQVNGIYSSGYDLNGNTGADLFTGTDASDIGVNSALANDPSQLQASGTAGATGDNTVVLALAQLANTNIAGLSNQTFSQSWAQTVGNLGDTISAVNELVNDSSSATQMLTSQWNSESGVSIDTEMTNLMQYEKSYEASAQLITTLNEMLQDLVDMKTT